MNRGGFEHAARNVSHSTSGSPGAKSEARVTVQTQCRCVRDDSCCCVDCAAILTTFTPNCPSRGEIPKILKLAWGKAFVEVVAMRRLACV